MILLVDDDLTCRERLARAIRGREFEVHEASNAKVGQELTEQHQPAASVLDLRMSGDSGVHIIGQFIELASETRVVVVTGFGRIASALKAVRLGAIDYLTKPAKADQVLAALGIKAERIKEFAFHPPARFLQPGRGSVKACH